MIPIQNRKEKVNNKFDYLWKKKNNHIQPKKRTDYAENVNTSTTAWNRIHLICRISIWSSLLSQISFSGKWLFKSSIWVTDATS